MLRRYVCLLWDMCDTYAHFFLMIFQSFKNFPGFYNLIVFQNLTAVYLTFCLFVLGRDKFFTVFVLKKPYFSISLTNYLINISLYLRAHANLGGQ